MGKLYDMAISLILKELEKDAKEIMDECKVEREFQDDTYNLIDSYGYGIYLNRHLTTRGYANKEPFAAVSKRWYGEEIRGREQIDHFLENTYSPNGVIDLAIVATMPYAKVLEEGGGGLHRSYKVISMSFDKLNQLKDKYKGIVKHIKV